MTTDISDQTMSQLIRCLDERKIRSYYYNHIKSCKDLDSLKKLLKIYPDKRLIEAIEVYGDLYAIAYYPRIVSYYLCGHPKYMMFGKVPHHVKENLDTILHRTRKCNDAALHVTKFLVNPFSDSVVNELNSVSGKPVRDYPPFDVLRYSTPSGKVVQLCRDEFESALGTGQDPHYQELVPDVILRDIIYRLQFASYWKLPASQPIMDILAELDRPVVSSRHLTYGNVRIVPRSQA